LLRSSTLPQTLRHDRQRRRTGREQLSEFKPLAAVLAHKPLV